MTERPPVLRGGCLCGAIRYEITGPSFEETNCHCSLCRKSAGAAYISWLTVASAHFRVVSGAARIFRSSASGSRQFCAACGTQLTFHGDAFPDEIDVTIASLDDPELVPPRANSFASDRLSWAAIDARLPVFTGEVPRETDDTHSRRNSES